MTIRIGNAPCSWGVEFADDPRNPTWKQVLQDCAEAGYRGIELGPIGFMPEDPDVLGDALAEHDLSLIGGVVFRPFHDPSKWDEARDAALTVPSEAVFVQAGQTMVYVVEADSTVSPRPVSLGLRQTESVEVVAGLEAGTQVVRAGHQKLFPGARVMPVGGEVPDAGGAAQEGAS